MAGAGRGDEIGLGIERSRGGGLAAPGRSGDSAEATAVSRRQFLARAATIGIAVPGFVGILQGCAPATRQGPRPGTASTPRPGTTSTGSGPSVFPAPLSAVYGEMLEISGLVAVSTGSDALGLLLGEIATETGVRVGAAAEPARTQAAVSVSLGDPSIPPQGYRLDVAAIEDRVSVTIDASDEAGAYSGLLSLRQIILTSGSTVRIRAATIEDAPGFARRGAILDPAPRTGVPTAAERDALMERVRFGVRYKLNFVDLPGRMPWPELVRYCADHHIELMVAWGYRDSLIATPRNQTKAQLDDLVRSGARSIAFNFDDIPTTRPDELARAHAEIFLDLYGYLRSQNPTIRVSATLPPYGGVPGRNLVASSDGSGERYLALMRDQLPEDVRVFWTGDGGVFSQKVTTAGARAYADAIGREVGLWDNDAIGYSRARTPCAGRDADLCSVIRSYMGNLAGEASWDGRNGEFALLTSLGYAWNPAAYVPAEAASAAEQILVTGSVAS